MGRLVSLFILITVVWQVITLIINQSNARKERQRAQELSRRRTSGTTTRSEPATDPRQRQAGAPSAAPGQRSRLDELTARRQQQLEQLRRRRIKGSGAELGRETSGGSLSGAPSGTVAAPPVQAEFPTSSGRPQQSGPGNIAARIERESTARRQFDRQQREHQRQATQTAESARERAAAKQKAAAPPPSRVASPYDQISDRIGVERGAAALAAASPYSLAAGRTTWTPSTATAGAAGAGAARLAAALRDREFLRRAIVINELLGPPVGLRGPSV